MHIILSFFKALHFHFKFYFKFNLMNFFMQLIMRVYPLILRVLYLTFNYLFQYF